MKHRHIAALILTLSTSASSLAFASPNQVYINLATGLPLNAFSTDVSTATNNSDVVIANVTGGTGNSGFVTGNSAVNTFTNVQQNGSSNSQEITNVGASNSSVQVYQGNSFAQSQINHQDVNAASHNDAQAITSGDSENVLVVQKGNENVSGTNVSGNNNSVTNIQQMKNIAAADIVDAKGNHYRGGNDSTVTISPVSSNNTQLDSANNVVSVNQYEGAVSHINIQGSSNAVNVGQGNWEFTTTRKYNPVNLMNIIGSANTDTVSQNGAGMGVNLVQNANNSSINVTQTLGGNQANITQVGSNESAIIKQTSSNIVTAAITDQSSSYNTLNITQTGGAPGTENSVFAPQSGNQNHLTTVQTGDSNVITGIVTGTGLTGQSGTNNVTTISQNGEANTAGFVQAAGDANIAAIAQVGSNHFVATNQQGSNNNAFISQANENGDKATITQIGNNNRGAIWEGADINGVAAAVPNLGGQFSNLTQVGNQNAVFEMQQGLNNSFTSTQTGNNNYVSSGAFMTAAQVATFVNTPWLFRDDANPSPQVGAYNKSVFTQTGDNNTMAIDPFGNNNSQTFTQKGNNNFIYGTAYGENNSETVTQTGGGNIAFTVAMGTGSGMTGGNNTIIYNQTSPSDTPAGQGNVIGSGGGSTWYDAVVSGTYNNVSITQNGSNAFYYNIHGGSSNQITINQDNSASGFDGSVIGQYRNGAIVNQYGNGNVVQVSQTGNNNHFDVIQNGNSFLNYTQTGNALTASINQAAGTSATIVQTHN